MNTELSIYKIKNYAYAACAAACLLFTQIISIKFNLPLPFSFIVFLFSFLVTASPIWYEARKLNAFLKKDQA